MKLSLIMIAALSFSYKNSEACTNLLITKGASTDGSVMITYNADAGGFMEPLYFMPAKDYQPGDSVEVYDWDSGIYLGKIKQVAHTNSVIGNMNEYQVAIGESTFGGRGELRDTNGRVDYGSLMYLALQRSKTAREAIKVMTDLVAEYGYYSSGESFAVADANEAWILEMLGKAGKERGAVWAAARIPDGCVSIDANQARIKQFPMNDKENFLYSPDVITFAVKQGYYKPDSAEFSFGDMYCPLEPGGALYCEGRHWRFYTQVAPSQNFSTDYFRAVKGAKPYPLYVKPDKKLSVEDVKNLVRDHFEGTVYDMTKGLAAGPFGCPYRWKNLQWQLSDDSVTQYGWERPVTSQQSAFTFVAQMRSWLPREVGGIFWYGVDDNYSNVYIPLYCCMNRVPKPFIGGSIKELSLESGFWVFNLVANLAYTKYSYIIKDIQVVQKEIEGRFHKLQPYVDKTALEAYNSDPKLAVEYLTDYSVTQAEITVDRWRDLWKSLVVKYNDGYINDVNVGGGRHPQGVGYGDEFLKRVIKERPGYYNVEWQEPVKKTGTK